MHERAADETSKRQLDLILQQARRAAGIVQNLLAFSRPSAQARSPIHLEEIVQQALQLAQPASARKISRLHSKRPDTLPPVLGDAKLLTQVFSEYHRERGAVDFLERPCRAPEAFRWPASRRSRYGYDCRRRTGHSRRRTSAKSSIRSLPPSGPAAAAGLGLTIALAVVKEHSGTIDVESSPGPEPRFRSCLPAVEKRVPKVPIGIRAEAIRTSRRLS